MIKQYTKKGDNLIKEDLSIIYNKKTKEDKTFKLFYYIAYHADFGVVANRKRLRASAMSNLNLTDSTYRYHLYKLRDNNLITILDGSIRVCNEAHTNWDDQPTEINIKLHKQP